MKAVRLIGYNQPVDLVDVPKPKAAHPYDVVVRIAGAGVCRTDLHIAEGVAPLRPLPSLPYTLGHENAGWIEETGSAVAGMMKGDPVILHPAITCGLCPECRAGNDMYCSSIKFPGVDGTDGGYAEYLLTSVRAVVPLPQGTDPAPLAPFADAGITAYHAVKKVAHRAHPGSTVVVIGIGGLGHFAVQLLKSMTPSLVIAVDQASERLAFARRLGADHAFLFGDAVTEIRKLTAGRGADIVMDFVAEGGTPDGALKMVRRGGTYSIVGYGGTVSSSTVDMIVQELNIVGNFVGTYQDLVELMNLNTQGRVQLSMKRYQLPDAAKALDDLKHGRILGRAVLIP